MRLTVIIFFCLQEVKKAILSDMIKLGKEAGLKSFEQVNGSSSDIDIFTKPGSVLPLVVKMSSCVKSNVNFADFPVFTPNPPSVLFTPTFLLAQ